MHKRESIGRFRVFCWWKLGGILVNESWKSLFPSLQNLTTQPFYGDMIFQEIHCFDLAKKEISDKHLFHVSEHLRYQKSLCFSMDFFQS